MRGDYPYIGSDANGVYLTTNETNFRCGNTRTALANWDSRISEVAAT